MLTRSCIQVYILYLILQLFFNEELYSDRNAQKPETINHPLAGPSAEDRASAEGSTDGESRSDRRVTDEEQRGATGPDDEEDEEVPELSLLTAFVLVVVVGVLVAVTAEWLVESVGGLVSGGKVSKEFAGLVLLPIVCNAAHHASALTTTVKDKLTLNVNVAVESSIVSFLPP